MGEVFGSDINAAAPYQGPTALDSILHYPMYNALTEAFIIPGPQNMSAVVDMMGQSKQKFKDPGLLGNFIENQDVPRWHNQSVDIQSLYNAMVFNFMSDGIPIVYYGQEQGMSGNSDPFNREPLWPSGYANSEQYQFISQLNQLRNYLVNSTDWLKSEAGVLSSTSNAIAISKGNVLSVMTNVGSGPQNVSIPIQTSLKAGVPTTDILTCTQWVVTSGGMLDVEYTKGGKPVILMSSASLQGSGICGNNATGNGAQTKSKVTGGAGDPQRPTTLLILFSFVLGLFWPVLL